MAIRRGRAWGNALGGYKRQRRDGKGRFASGKVGGSSRRGPSRTKSSPKRRSSTSSNIRKAKRRKYSKSDLNKQLQRNHRTTVAASFAGVYGGMAAGGAVGLSAGGPTGGMIGRQVGMVAGQVVAQRALSKSGRLVTNADFNKASKADQAAMARRIARAQKAHLAVNAAMVGYTAHQMMSATFPEGGNAYGWTAKAFKEAIARRGPRERTAGRFGANKGVYNISTAGRNVPRSNGSWGTTKPGQYRTITLPNGQTARARRPGRVTNFTTRQMFGP